MKVTAKLTQLTRLLTVVVLVFLVSHKGHAKQIPTVTGILKTSSALSTTVIAGTPSAINTILVPVVATAKDYNIQNTISLKYDLGTDTFFLAKTDVRVKVTINRWDFTNTPLPTTSRKLSISINNKLNQAILEQSSVNLTNGYKITMTVDSIWVNGASVKTLPRYVSVESEINMDRYYDFSSPSLTTVNMTGITPLDDDCDGIMDEVKVNWASSPSIVAEEFQLEWTYVNNYNSIGGSYPPSAFTTDFKTNSTRITTSDNSYKLSLLFDKGYIAFRVRAVGRNYLAPTEFMYGPWTSLDQVNMGSLSSNELYSVIAEHEKIKNWQYSSTYAEEGKKKEVINYFDGSLHNRQTVTKVNSDKNVIVGETMYDFQGRPAVNILPVPVVLNCTSTGSEPSIKYYNKFNVDDTNKVYSKNDFDLDASGACNSISAPMDTTSGASQYYSNNNPNKNQQQSFLPHAKEYPFTQIEYTPDNTGRIRNQTGVGNDYQFGSGKETKYLYGQPNQIQVDRLFGSETGDASHYKKNVVIDANGQTSVTYMNQEGKTIATALAGVPPTIGTSTNTRLDSLEYAGQNQNKLTVDLFNKNAMGVSNLNTVPASNDQIAFTTQLLVPFKSLYEFKYDLKIDTLGDACLRPNICISCVYDLEIQVKDECGVDLITTVTSTVSGNPWPSKPIKYVTGKVDTTGNKLTFNIHCTSPNLFKDSAKVNLLLKPGVYTVSKILKVNQEAKDFYVKNYLDSANNKCVKTLSQFQADALSKIDTSDCYNTCASCVAALGSKDDFVSSGQGTDVQWEFLVNQCTEPCRQKTLCDNTYDMMLSDVSPGGQYGKFNSITYSAASEPISVYNTANSLNPNIIPGSYANWQHPLMRLNGNFYNMYLDENGVRTKVNLSEPSPGVFVPPVVNTSSVYLDGVSGLKYTYPENLQKLSDFIPIWDPGFAKSLVVFHPEYAYYVSCSEQAIKFTGDNRSSDIFDSLLLVTETFNQALTLGIIKSNYTLNVPAINKIKDIWLTPTGNYDPFFTNNNFQYTTSTNPQTGTKTNIVMAGGAPYNVNLQSQMNYIINNYRFIGSTPYTMADIAAVLTRCGNNFGATPTATCLAFGKDYYPYTTPLNDSIRNKEWRLFRQFYFSEKQKLQFKRMDFYAKHGDDAYSNYYGGCNACIGNSSYNPFIAQMLITNPFLQPYPISAYFDLSQPCGYATSSNYGGVTKRFYDPANTGLNTGSVGSLLYQTTGQCPLAFQLQNFLSAMATNSLLNSAASTSLNTVSEFNPDLYLAVSGGVMPSSFVNYNWQMISSSGNLFTANIINPSTSLVKCTVTLDKTGTTIPSFSNIISLNSLVYDPTGIGTGAFKAVAVYVVGTSTLSANITGNSCINVKDCNFEPQCTANQFASEMSNLLSYMQSTGVLLVSGTTNLASNPSLNAFLTPTIKGTLGTPNSNMVYQFVGPNKLTFYDSSNPTTKIVLTVTVSPSGSGPSIKTFANIRSNYNNLFKMDGLNVSGVKISDIDGKAEKITPTQTIGISMGTCGLPEPAECSEKEHKVRKDLELLVNEILSTKPLNPNVDLFTLASFSSLLKSYVPTTVSSTNGSYNFSGAPNPNFDTLKINIASTGETAPCTFKLFHYRNNGTTYNFQNIINVSKLSGIGAPSIAGNYTYFKALATYSIGASTVKDTIYGYSCWPIKNCDPCPPKPAPTNSQAKLDSSYVAAGKASFDANLPAYDIYKTAVDTLNAKMGWTTASPNYVPPMDFLTYANTGFISAKQYVKFVTNFDTLIDNKVMLKPDTFVYNYGNLVNCNKDFNRYVNAIVAYNIRATSVSGATILSAIKDSTFYSNHLCDSSFKYVKYLRSYPAAGPNPVGILAYFGITTPVPNYTDSCKKLYEKYIKIHAQFLANPVVQSNCKEANINHPLYSYDEIVKANLCCTTQGLTAFNNYINSLATASVSCPPSLPSITSCTTAAAVTSNQDLCQKYYTTLKVKLNQYNASPYSAAHTHTLNPLIYPTFNSFLLAGYCDCVLNYIGYLNTYITAPASSTLTLPVDIDNYPGCPHSVAPPQDSCKKLYETYLQTVNAYNNYIKNNKLPYPLITAIFSPEEFIKNYCNCAKKFIANLQGVINGVKPTPEQIKLMTDLPSSCEKPCTNGPPDSAFVFPPYTKYDNPCVQQQINLALQNAANAYQQYKDSMTTVFADLYTRHCLSAMENFTYKYWDKEYHYTLYYYDQAGNLIKTIPPEGIEFVPVTSYLDPLEQKVISDRTYNQQNVFTTHRMATTYIYNSLNQLIFQSLPDHDNMDICDGVNPNGLDTGLVINSVQFVTANKGYLCGYIKNSTGYKRGYVYTSNDGGNFWTKVNGVTSGDLQKVQFVTATNGFAVSNFGMVFKTIDGGNNWDLLTSLYNPTSGTRFTGTLNDLYFTSTIGVVGGNKQAGVTSSIYYTTNNGASFTPATVTGMANGDTISGFTFDGTTYIATARNGNVGKMFTSTNATSWTQVTNFAANNLRKVQFISNTLGYAIGEEGTLLKVSTPLTATPNWQLLPTNVLGHFNDIYFKNATDGVAIIDSVPGKAKIWRTFNGGLTWQLLSVGGDYYNSLQLYDATQDRLIAAGKNGLLAKVLLNVPSFGIIKINTPNTNNNSFADADLHNPSGSLRSIVVSDASPIIYTSYNAQATAPTWLSINTTTLSPAVPASDALFTKVLMMDSVAANPYLKAILLTSNGKLYSFYRAFSSSAVICKPVNVSGGFSGKFFIDITSNNQTFTTPVYAFDTISKRMYSINFSGTIANATLLNNSTPITKNIKSIDIHNASNKLMMVGNSGHIEYTQDVTVNPIVWSDVTLNTLPVAITKVRTVSANNYIATGIDGAIWKNVTNASTWYLKNSGTVEKLNSMAVDNTGKGLIAANNGKLFTLTNANTQTPLLVSVTNPATAHLTDVAIEPTGTSAYVTAANGKVLYIPNYVTPVVSLASSPSPVSVNGVAYKNGVGAMVVGNNAFMGNYFATNASVTKNLFTKGLNSIHFYDVNNGLVIDSNNVIRRTTDGGTTWSVIVPTNNSPALTKVFSTSTNIGVLIGMNKYANVINGTGLTPITVPSAVPAGTDFYDVNFNSSNSNGVIVGSATRAAKIVPSGSSFVITYIGQAISPPKVPDFRAVHVFNNNTFIASGTKGIIYYYKGASFTQQQSYTAPAGLAQVNIILKDIYFHDYYTGYVVGSNGAAYKVILNDSIGNLGTSTNALAWQSFCSNALYMNYTTNSQIRKLDFNAIAFSNRTNGMIAGADSNIVIGSIAPNRYARLMKEQSGYYSTRFWYDKLGRLIVSQNTKQFNKTNPSNIAIKQAFSYTLYDQLGRITEVGEKYENHTTGSTKFNSIFGSLVNGYYNNNTIDDAKFLTWITGTGSRREVTKTYYDVQSILPLTYTQNNLRKRVATSTFEDVFDGNDLTYNHATHYTYDIHGNVTTLWQENTQVAVAGQNIKQIDYQFDLISGKVNKVIYSPGKVDQFIHRYSYDADNRITKVETSTNDLQYALDAKYFYYAHGPLARVEYGKDHVQGMDYAYTLQGWIKGVNSTTLKKAKDMGSDGDNSFANPNGNFARDIMGYSLNYYQGDYEAVNFVKWNTASRRFEAYNSGSDLFNSRSDLFNGNISAMVTSISKVDSTASGVIKDPIALPMGNAYRYDQLNRIKRSSSFTNIDTLNNIWLNNGVTIAGLYRNTFTYDANGNIKTQVKRDSVGGMIDSLVYNYEMITAGKKKRNRLYHVNDFVTSTPANFGDIKDQGAFVSTPSSINLVNNYSFDEIGNLIKDKAEKIDTIRWMVTGKIKAIIRTPGSTKENLYFDYDAQGNRIAKHVYTSANVWKNSTYYIRDAQGNVMSVYNKKPVSSSMSYKLAEQHLYGSSRIGMVNSNMEMIGAPPVPDTSKSYLGNKQYELANHLGNVITVISDKKIQIASATTPTLVDHYVSDQISASDYYPFGSVAKGRSFSSQSYRYGYQGSEKDNEVNAETYSTFYRALDTRLGRWFSLDPVKKPYESPYVSMGNNPIKDFDKYGNDLDVGKNKESKDDIKSLAKSKNQDFIKIDDNTGKVTLDFGKMSKEDIAKTLKKDEGLNLINDLVDSKKKFLYEATDLFLGKNSEGMKMGRPMYLEKDKIVNASDNGKDGVGGHTFLPKDGYNGQVAIQTNATYNEKSAGMIVSKSRASVVFHELAENYERTNNGVDYSGGNKGFGAHNLSITRENKWWNTSSEPGVVRDPSAPMPTKEQKQDLYKRLTEYNGLSDGQ
ncbi:MAG: hypothetical protein JSU07_02925 [Bacteroidetes bacterium]|nr:hypothetical protein [Bacteroidota bacterium]